MDDVNETVSINDETYIRPATVEDKAAVLAFCAQTWDGGDYIQWVWDDWLAQRTGALLLAVRGTTPVGMTHLRMVSEDEAWIEGLRVDPAVRRQGIARLLTLEAMLTAREQGAVVVRLVTSADNEASRGLWESLRFTTVAELVRYTAPALAADEGAPVAVTAPGPDDFERIWSWLEQSNLAPLTGGLELHEWTARAMTEPLLRAYLADGHVWLHEEWGTIQALAVATPLPGNPEDPNDPPFLEARYLDGAADGLGRLALALRRVAATHALTTVQLWLPDLLILRDAMDGAGYERHHLMLLYARDLPQ